jgi:putative tryptophan/tyrosine transport system permease protein
MASLMSIINQGLVFSLVAMAVYLTSRVIHKDDLSVEGSFGLGGAITAVMLENTLPITLTLLASLAIGALVGICTGLLYTKLKMNHLMAGLVSTTACFSIALALASSNKIIQDDHTIFGSIALFTPTYRESLILSLISVAVLVLVKLVLRSEIGLVLRAVGENPGILVHLGKSSTRYYVLGFTFANAITALAGSLFAQWSGFFSITGNIGVLVTGLATLMIAELLKRRLSITIILAAVVYQSIFLATLELGIDPVWNNLIKALLMVALVSIACILKRRPHHA